MNVDQIQEQYKRGQARFDREAIRALLDEINELKSIIQGYEQAYKDANEIAYREYDRLSEDYKWLKGKYEQLADQDYLSAGQ